ncbi:MAG: ribonuclease III [Oscillospiraceae bacterium]|jgi:ribonuclease-3|nr:ribonuclease III [Oscillospiraceae bacterium]
MELLETALDYSFGDAALLDLALSHSSYAHERGEHGAHNERLEFLGDSVLGFLSAEYFYGVFSNLPEGELTKKRAAAVCESALSAYAKSINLGKHLRVGRGEESSGGRERPSILADAFEAVLAAIYLDGGMDCARRFILRFLRDKRFSSVSAKDNKTLLQEVVQRTPGALLEYALIGEEGPAHEKLFTSAVMLDGREIGRGTEHSKKRAEQLAAANALRQLTMNSAQLLRPVD